MITETTRLENYTIAYPLEKLAPPEQVLFLDIETTGFTAKSSVLYMIGCAYFENGDMYICQWMAENYEQEKDVLYAFFNFASRFRYLIHFNGNNFDLPYLLQKCEQYGLPYNFNAFKGIDLYKRISPYKHFLRLPNCKQKTIEQYLGIGREEIFSGGELIGIYHDYVQQPDELAFTALLLHNYEDVLGMLNILPILAYYDLFNGDFRAKKVQANYYTDHIGNRRQELIMTLILPTPLPVPLSVTSADCYFKGEGNLAHIKVPIYEEELKYFYANYKDYYYLPMEDVALHKSVATFVDKEHRLQATAATCYTRKHSLYLPQWEPLMKPFFKRDYKSKELFFELTDELKRDRAAFAVYAKHIIEMMCSF
ncbi:MAG: ribonuclease H-like domain-containing protein [Lachnospiraceae bacterium]|nr:ribonuclease H-like domain-containing protein [Lachnospiraceae bacterium]